MPKYLVKARYSVSGAGGILNSGGTARRPIAASFWTAGCAFPSARVKLRSRVRGRPLNQGDPRRYSQYKPHAHLAIGLSVCTIIEPATAVCPDDLTIRYD